LRWSRPICAAAGVRRALVPCARARVTEARSAPSLRASHTARQVKAHTFGTGRGGQGLHSVRSDARRSGRGAEDKRGGCLAPLAVLRRAPP